MCNHAVVMIVMIIMCWRQEWPPRILIPSTRSLAIHGHRHFRTHSSQQAPPWNKVGRHIQRRFLLLCSKEHSGTHHPVFHPKWVDRTHSKSMGTNSCPYPSIPKHSDWRSTSRLPRLRYLCGSPTQLPCRSHRHGFHRRSISSPRAQLWIHPPGRSSKLGPRRGRNHPSCQHNRPRLLALCTNDQCCHCHPCTWSRLPGPHHRWRHGNKRVHPTWKTPQNTWHLKRHSPKLYQTGHLSSSVLHGDRENWRWLLWYLHT
mmetsp:Transcript_122/g.264  ORF Transcript_122/g.264 Transcript_122/m.264 type:complete len:258 (-) Transcript_122:5031-5804(-)